MRMLRTIALVPPPALAWVAILAVTLWTYVLFEGRDVTLAGYEVTALRLTVGVYLFLMFTRAMLASYPELRSLGWTGVIVIPLIVLVPSVAIAVATPSWMMSGLGLMFLTQNAVTLIVLSVWPEEVPKMRSFWACDEKWSLGAVRLQHALSALFGPTLILTAQFSGEMAFVMMLTFGRLGFYVGVNWIVVLCILSRPKD